MTLPPTSEPTAPEARRDLRLTWLGSAGPCLWFALLVGLYIVAGHECGSPSARWSWWLWAVGALACAATCALGLRKRRRESASPSDVQRQKAKRVHFMLDVSLALNLLSLVLLLGFAVPLYLLRPCE
jgi:hypothetical protein